MSTAGPLKEAEMCLANGAWDEAIERFQNLSQELPTTPEVHIKLALALAVRGRFGAIVGTYLQWARAALESDNLEQAEVALDEALSLRPESLEARELRIELGRRRNNEELLLSWTRDFARLALEHGEGERSVEKLRLACDQRPEDLELSLELAETCLAQGLIKEGEARYRQVANSYLDSNRPQQALEAFRRLKVVSSEEPGLLMQVGRLYLALEQLDEAEQEFRAVLRLNLEHQEALMELGKVCQLKGRFRSSLLAFKKVLNLNPDHADAVKKSAELHLTMGNPEEAIELLLQGGVHFLESGERELAIEFYQLALGIDRDNLNAQQALTNLGAPREELSFSTPELETQQVPEEPSKAPELVQEPELPRAEPVAAEPDVIEVIESESVVEEPRWPRTGLIKKSELETPEDKRKPVYGKPRILRHGLKAKPGLTATKSKPTLKRKPMMPDTRVPQPTIEPVQPEVEREELVATLFESELVVEDEAPEALPALEWDEPEAPIEPEFEVAETTAFDSWREGESLFEGFKSEEAEELFPDVPDDDVHEDLENLFTSDDWGMGEIFAPEATTDVVEENIDELFTPATTTDVVEEDIDELFTPATSPDMVEEDIDDLFTPETAPDVVKEDIDDLFTPQATTDLVEDDIDDLFTPETAPDVVEEDIDHLFTSQTAESLKEGEMEGLFFPADTEMVVKEIDEFFTPETTEAHDEVSTSYSDENLTELFPDLEPPEQLQAESVLEQQWLEEVERLDEILGTNSPKETVPGLEDILKSTLPAPAQEAPPEVIEQPTSQESEKTEEPTLMEALEAHQERETAAASIARLREVLRLNPGNQRARLELGDLLLRFGMVAEAVGHYRRALQQEPNSLDVHRRVIEAELWNDNPHGAAETLISSAQIHLERGDYDQSLDRVTTLLALDPTNQNARTFLIAVFEALQEQTLAAYHLTQMAEEYLSRGDTAEALGAFERLLAIKPTPALRERVAEQYHALGEAERAQQNYQALIDHFSQQQNWTEAVRVAERVLRLYPGQLDQAQRLQGLYERLGDRSKVVEHQLRMAQAFLGRGQLARAIDECEALLSGQPDHLEARQLLLQISLDTLNFPKATEQYQQLCQQMIADGQLADLRELSIEILSRHSEIGLASLEQLLSLNQCELVGEVLARIEDSGELREGILLKLRQQAEASQGLETRAQFAALCFHLGDFDSAIEQYQILRRHSEHEVASYRMLGLCFARRHGSTMLELALRQFRKGLSVAGPQEQNELRYDLARVLEENDRAEEALRELQLCDPEFRDVQEWAERLKSNM